MKQYLLKDLFQKKIDKKVEEEDTTIYENEKSKEISNIVNMILKITKSHYINSNIEKQVKDLVDEYNASINEIYNNNNTILNIKCMDENILYCNLLSNLKDILDRLNKYKDYYIILDLINNIINVIDENNAPDKINDDLINDIITIKNTVLPFLGNQDIIIEIKQILLKEKENIYLYINNKEDNVLLKYHDINEFKLYIRENIHPHLYKLYFDTRDKDIENEIKEGYNILSKGLFVKSKNDYLNFIFNEINKLIYEINTNGNDLEKNKLKELLSYEINDEETISIKFIEKLYCSVYKIIIDMEQSEKREKKFKKYLIKIK